MSALPRLATLHTLVFDFDGVFTDNKVYVDANGTESVRCDRADGLAFDMLRAYCRLHGLDVRTLIISKEKNQVVRRRAEKLRVDCLNGVADKVTLLDQHLAERFPERGALDGVLYMGNDLNDLPMAGRVGCFVAPADAHPRVLAAANAVLPRAGGDGCVRLLIERLIEADRMSNGELAMLTITED